MKRAIMQMTPELLSQALVEGNEIHCKVENGLPEDAKFINGRHVVNLHGDCVFELIYESEEFEDITDEGAILPLLKPAKFIRLNCGEGAEERSIGLCGCGQEGTQVFGYSVYCEDCI